MGLELKIKTDVPGFSFDVLEAYTLADRVLIYSGGRVIQSGLPSEVFKNPVNGEAVSLVDLKNYTRDIYSHESIREVSLICCSRCCSQ
jgi:ABC-type proline/glycine betaine transport system ATPase subunit